MSGEAVERARWYRRRMPIFWWLGKRSYVGFIARELTSLAVAYATVLVLVEVALLDRGAEAHRRFVALLGRPPVVAWHALLLAVLLFHTLTWLNLAPKAMVVRLGARRVPNGALLAAHYLGWIAASALVFGLLARS